MKHTVSAPLVSANRLLVMVWLLPIMGVFIPSKAHTQSPASQLWLTYNQQARVISKWGYMFDLNYRAIASDNWELAVAAARVGAVFYPNEHVRLGAGYAWFGQWVQGNDAHLQHENRLWQQVLWHKTKPAFSYMQRIRLEERFRHVSLPAGKEASAYTTRLRYMLQFQGMLVKPKKPDGFALKWQAADEIMLHTGEYVQQHYFEQNRLIGGIVLAPSSKIELAILYQYSLLYLPIPEHMQQLHTLRLTLQHSLDFSN